MAKGFLRYTLQRKLGQKCYDCGREFEIGDEIVRTRSNGYIRRHANCYVDAHGEKISEDIPR